MKISKLEERLKSKDLRLTEPRKLIFESLRQAHKALSPKDIHAQLKKKVDLASIYRNLTLFKELSLVHSLSEGTYSLCEHRHTDEKGKHKHIHVIVRCEGCGKTEEIKEHQDRLCKASNALVEFSHPLKEIHSILMQGHCIECKNATT